MSGGKKTKEMSQKRDQKPKTLYLNFQSMTESALTIICLCLMRLKLLGNTLKKSKMIQ
jgi:hypothetical protein